MSKINLEKILSITGPCLSSELAETLVKNFGLTPSAARKRISRSSENIHKLSYIVFPHRSRFVYLTKEYASRKFWGNLYAAMRKENSSYYMAINALVKRGGMIKKSHFGIVCGSPIRQKNHISYESLLASLMKSEIVKEISNNQEEIYLYLNEYEDNKYTLLERQEQIELVEGIMLEQSRTWLKQLGMVSYGKSKIMGEDIINPRVGTFEWHITGPSYIHPLPQTTMQKKQPGFIACDINVNPTSTTDDINCFIKKMEMTASMKKIGRCIFIYISNSYTKDALHLAKSKGVMALTFNNVFGKRNSSSVEKISQILSGSLKKVAAADEILTLTKELNERNGLTKNLKGKLFEHLCAEIKRRLSNNPTILIGREYKSFDGEVAESDVTSISHDMEISFIECKGIKRGSLLDESEVDKWLDKRIPTLLSYCKTHPDYVNIKKKFELWVTGDLSEESRNKIKTFDEKSKNYSIEIKGPVELYNMVKEINDKPMKQVLISYFLKRDKPVPDAKQHPIEC